MQLIRFDPWNIGRLLEEDFDYFPSRRKGEGLNLYETNDSFIAEAVFPGIPEDRIDVTIDDGTVTISGSYEESKEDRDKKRYFTSSISRSYDYSFRMPVTVSVKTEPKVEFENGIVKMIFPKKAKAPPKKIKISSKNKTKGTEKGK